MLIYSETILFAIVIYLFKLNNKNTRKQSEIHPKLTKKGINTMSMDMNTQLVDVALVSFFNLKHFASCSTVSHVKFKLVNVTTFILF